ncbi:MAG: ATP-binding protein [Planctomycetota bacterium]
MPNREPAPSSARLAINAQWFTRLRWVAAAGQLATILFVAGPLGVRTPVAPLLVLVGVTAVSNALYGWWIATRRVEPSRPSWHAILGALMVLDLVVLTAMLRLTGGPTNPFVVFYFVNLALSGIVLPGVWSWGLSAAAIVAFGWLSCQHESIDALRDPLRLESLEALRATGERSVPLAVFGAWVAFAAGATVLVSFTTRLTAEVRASDRLRREAEARRARAEKLEALGTLAAGAAHELATPLSTIAVAAHEAHRELQAKGADAHVVEDLALVRREIDRCRTILRRMATDTGQAEAGAPERLTAGELVGDVLDELPAASRVEVRWELIPRKGSSETISSEDAELVAPSVALAQAIRAVVQNAIDATDAVGEASAGDGEGRVTITGDVLGGALRLRVADRGEGMTAEQLERAGEPFFTTKSPGRGMGLGLFLTRSVLERQGGSLRLESPEGEGTTATIVLPLAPAMGG